LWRPQSGGDHARKVREQAGERFRDEMPGLHAKRAADLAHKPERRVTMSAVKERLIELSKMPSAK